MIFQGLVKYIFQRFPSMILFKDFFIDFDQRLFFSQTPFKEYELQSCLRKICSLEFFKTLSKMLHIFFQVFSKISVQRVCSKSSLKYCLMILFFNSLNILSKTCKKHQTFMCSSVEPVKGQGFHSIWPLSRRACALCAPITLSIISLFHVKTSSIRSLGTLAILLGMQ